MTEQAVEYSSSIVSAIEGLQELNGDIDLVSMQETNPPGVRWEIRTKSEAAWALRKMAKIKAAQEENEAAAKAEIDRIMDWRDGENTKLQRSIDFFTYLLEGYFLASRKADPAIKTIKLPHGSLKMRTQQLEYAYDDGDLLDWCEQNLRKAVVVKKSISKQVVKDHIKETGELPDGVTITDRPEQFSVEVV